MSVPPIADAELATSTPRTRGTGHYVLFSVRRQTDAYTRRRHVNGGAMSICLECGNSIGNETACARCASTHLSGVDRIQAGLHPSAVARSHSIDWDAAATSLDRPPSRQSMREVRREARSRKSTRRQRDRSAQRARTTEQQEARLVRSRSGECPPISSRRDKRWVPWVILGAVVMGIRWLSAWDAGLAPVDVPTTTQPADPFVQLAQILAVPLAVYFAIAALVARSATRKGRSAFAWLLLALLMPVVSWLIVAYMAPSPEAISAKNLRRGTAIACPSCRAAIPREAAVCRFCGRAAR